VAVPTLLQLIECGSLPIGSKVYHRRRHPIDGDIVIGTIWRDGIEVNGRVFRSASGAARSVTGGVAENGWRWWRLKSDDTFISDLRTSQ